MKLLSLHTLFYNTPAIIVCTIIGSFMLLAFWLGFRLKKRKLIKLPDHDSLGPIEGSMLGLLALLLAFTFGMAGEKFNNRKELMIKETSTIATSIQKTDLYPDSVRSEMREFFRQYLESRINYFNLGIDNEMIQLNLAESRAIYKKIWQTASAYARKNPESERATEIISAPNEMYEAMIVREDARLSTVPESIWILLILLTFSASFISGYGTKSHSIDWPLVFGFIGMTMFTLFIIMDLDRPTRGIITLKNANNEMEVNRSMLIDN